MVRGAEERGLEAKPETLAGEGVEPMGEGAPGCVFERRLSDPLWVAGLRAERPEPGSLVHAERCACCFAAGTWLRWVG